MARFELAELEDLRQRFTQTMLAYKFAVDEVLTKVEILRQEYLHLHRDNPIEHVSSRLKSPESIVAKARRKGLPLDLEVIRRTVLDIAGVRITCSFPKDVYTIRDVLLAQSDVTLITERDYIASPKPNGYRSLHLIVQVPVFLSRGPQDVTVEVQIRTIAQDFWASTEHKIYYKYDHEIPEHLRLELARAAETARELDARMEALHQQVRDLDGPLPTADAARGGGLVPTRAVLESFLGGRPPVDDEGGPTRD